MPQPLETTAKKLNDQFSTASAEAVLATALDRYDQQIALVSSFGAEAAAMLHMLSRIDPTTPVLMLDTELLFPETLAYQTELSVFLGLTDVRRIKPIAAEPDLHLRDTVACCAQRKVEPLARALTGFEAVITGRKRFQTGQRAQMDRFEVSDGRIKVNPLADWSVDQVTAYFDDHALPRHPLVAKGYPSIGCAPCTSPVSQGESPRAGRWRNEDREECGIHFSADGTIKRKAG